MALIKINNRSSEDNAIHGRRNLLHNGDMRISQRRTEKTEITGLANAPDFLVDRWSYRRIGTYSNLQITMSEQAITDLDGFDRSLKLTVATPEGNTTTGNGTGSSISTTVELQDMTQLEWGSSDAKSVTISFWVKSSIAGDYTVFVKNNSAVTTDTCIYVPYTISSANTWEKKELTVSGDTVGTWGDESRNGPGISVYFMVDGDEQTQTANTWGTSSISLGMANGTTNNGFTNTSGATFEITGIQMEEGTKATPFDYRPMAEELQICQRYYEKFGQGWWARFESGSQLVVNGQFRVEKRSAPTILLPSGGTIRLYEWGVADRDATPTITSTAMWNKGGHFKLSGFSTGGSTGEIWGVGGVVSGNGDEPFEAKAEF